MQNNKKDNMPNHGHNKSIGPKKKKKTSTSTSVDREHQCDRLSITSVRSEIDDYWHRVLALCHQMNPYHFGLEFPSRHYDQFEYVDSGTYSHVIRAISRYPRGANIPIVFKIIKVVQRTTLSRMTDITISGFELYLDVYQEIVTMKMLSNLHDNVSSCAGYEYQTHSYPRIFRSRVVHGEIPNYFLIRRYDETMPKIKPVERFDETFGVPREHLVVVMKFGGDSLWDRIQANCGNKLSPDQIIAICYQLTFALAVAEQVYQFEHRDLHICNLLVKPTKKSYAHFKLHSIDYYVKTFDVKACIIDTTFSRMQVAGVVYFTDLSGRLKSSTENPKPEEHEAVYATMYRLVCDRWTDWFPETNIFWLKYCYKELLTCAAFEEQATDQQRTILNAMIAAIAKHKLVYDYVRELLFESGDSLTQPMHRSVSEHIWRRSDPIDVDRFAALRDHHHRNFSSSRKDVEGHESSDSYNRQRYRHNITNNKNNKMHRNNNKEINSKDSNEDSKIGPTRRR